MTLISAGGAHPAADPVSIVSLADAPRLSLNPRPVRKHDVFGFRSMTLERAGFVLTELLH
jgi:hypothetical protein